jgi:branched-chain amino acid transport system permease protein
MSIYSIFAVSYNVALGYAGLLNLGHVAFFGLGAYTSALLTKAGVPFVVAFICAGVIAAVFGYLLVYLTRELKGDYLVLATLGFSFVFTSLMLNWRWLTRGPLGLPGIAKPNIFGLVIKGNLMYFIFVLIIAAICLYIMWRIVSSPFGRLLEATRDDELGLRVLGKNTFNLKAKAMTVSAFFAGLAGSLFAHYISYIDPGTFYIMEIILILSIVIIGGVASFKGSIVGTIILILLPELLRFLSISSSILGPLRQMLYAVVLLGLLMYRPRGIFGRVDLE